VRSQGSGPQTIVHQPVNVSMTVNTPSADSFRRSHKQVVAGLIKRTVEQD
jgi:hypothetical protein